jgi:hypothetical protein
MIKNAGRAKHPAFFCSYFYLLYDKFWKISRIILNFFLFGYKSTKNYCIFAKGTENYPIYEENNTSRNALGRIRVDAG